MLSFLSRLIPGSVDVGPLGSVKVDVPFAGVDLNINPLGLIGLGSPFSISNASSGASTDTSVSFPGGQVSVNGANTDVSFPGGSVTFSLEDGTTVSVPGFVLPSGTEIQTTDSASSQISGRGGTSISFPGGQVISDQFGSTSVVFPGGTFDFNLDNSFRIVPFTN